jgi:FMN phosphatase YigB (HAD superfamily)
MKITTLLVDLDGTLLANHDLALSFDFATKAIYSLRKMTGSTSKAIKTLLALKSELDEPKKKATATTAERLVEVFSERLEMPAAEARKLLRKIISLIFPKLEKHFYPVPGAKEFLEWAQQHYTLILATTPVWSMEIIHLRIKWAGLDPKMFKFITDANTMHAIKPSPKYYQQILDLKKLNAEECVLIGNDFKMDLPATKIGIVTYIIGKTSTAQKIKTPSGAASGWSGNYKALKKFLEKEAF